MFAASPARWDRSALRKTSSPTGSSTSAPSAAPQAIPSSAHGQRRSAAKITTATTRWKLDSGCPQRNCSPTTSASQGTDLRWVASSAHGISAHTLACG